jgi:hypothetical protein
MKSVRMRIEIIVPRAFFHQPWALLTSLAGASVGGVFALGECETVELDWRRDLRVQHAAIRAGTVSSNAIIGPIAALQQWNAASRRAGAHPSLFSTRRIADREDAHPKTCTSWCTRTAVRTA